MELAVVILITTSITCCNGARKDSFLFRGGPGVKLLPANFPSESDTLAYVDALKHSNFSQWRSLEEVAKTAGGGSCSGAVNTSVLTALYLLGLFNLCAASPASCCVPSVTDRRRKRSPDAENVSDSLPPLLNSLTQNLSSISLDQFSDLPHVSTPLGGRVPVHISVVEQVRKLWDSNPRLLSNIPCNTATEAVRSSFISLSGVASGIILAYSIAQLNQCYPDHRKDRHEKNKVWFFPIPSETEPTKQYLVRSLPSEIPVKGEDDPPSGCDRTSVRMKDGQCAPLLSPGPCPYLQWVLLDRETGQGECSPRLCSSGKVFVEEDQMCHDINEPGFCPDNQRLFLTAWGEAICDCKDGKYHGPDNNCYQINEKAYCYKGSVLQFHQPSRTLMCRTDPCKGLNNALMGNQLPFAEYEDNVCYQYGSRGPCEETERYGFNVELMEPSCVSLEEAGLLQPKRSYQYSHMSFPSVIDQTFPHYEVSYVILNGSTWELMMRTVGREKRSIDEGKSIDDKTIVPFLDTREFPTNMADIENGFRVLSLGIKMAGDEASKDDNKHSEVANKQMIKMNDYHKTSIENDKELRSMYTKQSMQISEIIKALQSASAGERKQEGSTRESSSKSRRKFRKNKSDERKTTRKVESQLPKTNEKVSNRLHGSRKTLRRYKDEENNHSVRKKDLLQIVKEEKINLNKDFSKDEIYENSKEKTSGVNEEEIVKNKIMNSRKEVNKFDTYENNEEKTFDINEEEMVKNKIINSHKEVNKGDTNENRKEKTSGFNDAEGKILIQFFNGGFNNCKWQISFYPLMKNISFDTKINNISVFDSTSAKSSHQSGSSLTSSQQFPYNKEEEPDNEQNVIETDAKTGVKVQESAGNIHQQFAGIKTEDNNASNNEEFNALEKRIKDKRRSTTIDDEVHSQIRNQYPKEKTIAGSESIRLDLSSSNTSDVQSKFLVNKNTSKFAETRKSSLGKDSVGRMENGSSMNSTPFSFESIQTTSLGTSEESSSFSIVKERVKETSKENKLENVVPKERDLHTERGIVKVPQHGMKRTSKEEREGMKHHIQHKPPLRRRRRRRKKKRRGRKRYKNNENKINRMKRKRKRKKGSHSHKGGSMRGKKEDKSPDSIKSEASSTAQKTNVTKMKKNSKPSKSTDFDDESLPDYLRNRGRRQAGKRGSKTGPGIITAPLLNQCRPGAKRDYNGHCRPKVIPAGPAPPPRRRYRARSSGPTPPRVKCKGAKRLDSRGVCRTTLSGLG